MSQLRIDAQGACWLGEFLLHPANQPGQAALQQMHAFLQQANSQDTLIIMGAGLGWHIQAALSRLLPEQLIIYQAWPGEKNWSTCLGPQLPQLEWVDNAQELAAALGARLVYAKQAGGRVAVYAAPAYAASMPRLLEQLREQAGRGLNRANKDRQTRLAHAATWGKHLQDNAQALFDLPDIFTTARSFVSVPALVIGAGPSLDSSLPLLGDMRQRALVLAAASALGPMAAMGLRPHLAVALEGLDESRQFVDVDYAKTCLLASLNGHPNHFAAWKGTKAFFHANSWLPKVLQWGGMLPTGGHATSAAFSLACLWGCNPIILVGQDLAYTGGKVHANACPGGEEEEQRHIISVPAVRGGMVNTSSVMQSYMEWYEEAAAYLRQSQPQLKIINATAAGAAIAGFAWAELDETMAQLPLQNDMGARLPALLANTSRLNYKIALPGVLAASALLSRSFSSVQELSACLQDSPLADWLDDELDNSNWRQSLSRLRLLLNTLKSKLQA